MPPYMTYGNERNIKRIRERFGVTYPDQKRAEKPRAVSDGNRVYIFKVDIRLIYGFSYG